MIQKCLFSVDDFKRMIDVGIFEQRSGQIELIEGELIAMPPASAKHSDIIALLSRWSIENTDVAEFDVRVQSPIGLPELASVPEPDLAWVHNGNYRDDFPLSKDVGLVIEVCVSNGAYDRGRKARLYARAGIQDYWLVDAVAEQIEIRREPLNTGYAEFTTHDRTQSIHPLCQPSTKLVIAELFPG